MTSIKSNPPLLSLAVLLLSGCAGSSDRYPSLAIRDAERVAGQFMPIAPDQPPVPPVVSAQGLAEIVAKAAEMHRQFVANEPGATRLVEAARGTGSESDARSRALVALADLTSLRGQTAIALASLDDLETEAASTLAPLAEIRAAQTEVVLLVTEQDAVIDSLGERFGQ